MTFVPNLDIFDDKLDLLEIIDIGFPHLRYTRSDHFHDMDELNFYKRFRLMKQTCLAILIQIEEDLEFPNDICRNDSVPPMNQLLLPLKFYATNGHLSDVAYIMGVHSSTASRIIKRVSQAPARLRPRYVKMPEIGDVQQVQQNFFQLAGFPRVIGAVDGTHIRIQSPGGDDGEIFRNRKGYFSINCQVVCDANMRIQDVVARWPGSTHDATIFNNSRVNTRLENGDFANSVLLGDSGYPIKDYLLTPLGNPVSRGEQRYNEAHIRTRNVVERVFGCWKRRFPVLAYGARIRLDTMLTVIVATATLQNIASSMNEAEPPIGEGINEEELNILIEEGQMPEIPINHVNNIQNNIRDLLINNYFANL